VSSPDADTISVPDTCSDTAVLFRPDCALAAVPASVVVIAAESAPVAVVELCPESPFPAVSPPDAVTLATPARARFRAIPSDPVLETTS